MKRMVIVTVDTLVEILKDYLAAEGLPSDAWVKDLMVKPNERGKFALTVGSEHWPNDGKTSLTADFQIKRFWAAGVGEGV